MRTDALAPFGFGDQAELARAQVPMPSKICYCGVSEPHAAASVPLMQHSTYTEQGNRAEQLGRCR